MTDFNDSSAIADRLTKASKRLHELAGSVGMARQIKEFASDRRKMALARWVAPLLKDGESATSAEHKARSSGAYIAEMDRLASEYESAESTLAQYAAEQASFEAARSLLSWNKETLRNLPE